MIGTYVNPSGFRAMTTDWETKLYRIKLAGKPTRRNAHEF